MSVKTNTAQVARVFICCYDKMSIQLVDFLYKLLYRFPYFCQSKQKEVIEFALKVLYLRTLECC